MITAIMLIKTRLRDVEEVTNALAEMEDVRVIFTTTGQYDIVAILDEKDSEALAETVTRRIAQVPGITDTTTLLAIRRHSQALMDRMFGVGLGGEEREKKDEG